MDHCFDEETDDEVENDGEDSDCDDDIDSADEACKSVVDKRSRAEMDHRLGNAVAAERNTVFDEEVQVAG